MEAKAAGRRRRAAGAVLAACAMLLLPVATTAGDQARGMRSECETTFVVTGVVPPNLYIAVTGVCQAAHLGRTTSIAQQVVTFGGAADAIVSDVVTTAANGDTLHSMFVGVGVLDFTTMSATFSGTETYVGGTGRFANASGSSALAGGAQFTSPTSGFGWYATRGSIAY